MTKFLIFTISIFCVAIVPIHGHGRLLEPVSRVSRFRVQEGAPINYDDNAVFCGGFAVQHYINGGKCGICGDDYRMPIPRDNELGGYFGGDGVIVKSYAQGSAINVRVEITASHKGYFYFDLCNFDELSATGKILEEEECFKRISLPDGDDKWILPVDYARTYDIQLNLPKGVTCRHCVFRWTYVTGNSWGVCPDGTGKLGCGAQEHFRACSDITISKY